MHKSRHRQIRSTLRPLARAIGLALLSMGASTAVLAGPGYGDNLDQNGNPMLTATFFANSPRGMRCDPLGGRDATTGACLAQVNTGRALRKFVDTLPGFGKASANNLGQYIPVAVATKWVDGNGNLTNDDYFEIAVVEYQEKMHSDLAKPSLLRGYVQIDPLATRTGGLQREAGSDGIALTNPDGSPMRMPVRQADGSFVPMQAYAYDNPHYLGPAILATRGVATRLKFVNLLPVGRAVGAAAGVQRNGDLFLPVDESILGAGYGPYRDALGNPVGPKYTQNRASVHLHGGDTPWISDGLPHQWFTPAGEADAANPASVAAQAAAASLATGQDIKASDFLRGVSNKNVPDMADPGPGASTYYFPNGQSARLLWYHDHTSGLTRLNVYAGMAAPYNLTDPVEQDLIARGVIPGPADTIPLVIQEKSFVPADVAPQLDGAGNESVSGEDARWDQDHWGRPGDLWYPHVYETNQNPATIDGWNNVGRWHYGPWFWPVFPAPLALPTGAYGDVTVTPESWMDTPLVNGTAYPTLEVDPKAYRFKILNASNDRFFTLSWFLADGNSNVTDAQAAMPYGPSDDGRSNTEVRLVYTNTDPNAPAGWPQDGKLNPHWSDKGPAMLQIANEGGLLPQLVKKEALPSTFVWDLGAINITNFLDGGVYLGNAERADVVVDFSQFAGKTLILYNDNPAPVPAGDPRNDYFYGNGDESPNGGTEPTRLGYGPSTRTVMQVKVRAAAPALAFDEALLAAELPKAYGLSQDRPLVGQKAYNQAFKAVGGTDPYPQDTFGSIYLGSTRQPTLDYTPAGVAQTITGFTISDGGMQYQTLKPPLVQFVYPAGWVGTPATAHAQVSGGKVVQIVLDSVGTPTDFAPGVTLVSQAGAPGYGAKANVVTTATQHIKVENKAIQELFDPNYGRMNATLGIEVPFTSAVVQTTIPLGYADATTETLKPGEVQIWKVTHNGVDTHPVHFHLVNVQLVNRVDWANVNLGVRPEELGWKDTIKFNQLEDLVIAVKSKQPPLPFGVPYSIRPLEPSAPVGSTEGIAQINVTDPNNPQIPIGQPMTVLNDLTNFGWEYVWHCHILGHEENDFMRAIKFDYKATAPAAPTGLAGTGDAVSGAVGLSWTDATPGFDPAAGAVPAATLDPANTANEIGFNVYRAPIAADNSVGAYAQVGTVAANVTGFRETAPLGNYMYKVSAYNAHSEVMSAELRVQAGDIPGAPSALTAVADSATSITLSWTDNAGNETGFRVMRNGVQVAELAADATGWTDTTTSGATSYTYQVKAFNAVGESALSNPATVTTLFAPPTGLSATAIAPRQVQLSWTDNAGNETGFVIERASVVNGVAGAFLQIATAPANAANGATSFIDTSVADGSAYLYQVRDQNAAATSAPSNTAAVSTPLAAPSGLALTVSVVPARVTLTWVDNSVAETAYEVRRDGVVIATLPAGTTAFTDTTVVDGASYAYVVAAVNPSGAAATAAQTATLALAAPSGTTVAVTANAPLTASVAWADNSVSETGYTVQRATNATFTQGLATFAAPAGSTSYADATVLAGRTYYYRVQTVKGATVSAWSPTATVTVAVPAAPSGLRATLPPVSTNPPAVTLTWVDNATTETGYVVMRATDTGMTQNVVLTPLPANTTTWVDTTVVPGTSYNYRVYATNAVGNSGMSARVRVLPGQLWPAATVDSAADTTGAVVAGQGRRTVTLNWTNVLDGNGAAAVTGLAVQRSTTPGFANPSTTAVPLGTQSFAVSNLQRNTTYYFRVRTTNASGQTLSNVLSVTTQP
jgi:FtsP/CotA-like multicopper oxidase with cupredoxin domain/fibronectin type 3 domain-containing protein